MKIYETGGVYYDEAIGEWQASININGQEIYLGSYSHLLDAIAVRKREMAEAEKVPGTVIELDAKLMFTVPLPEESIVKSEDENGGVSN